MLWIEEIYTTAKMKYMCLKTSSVDIIKLLGVQKSSEL